MRKLAWFAFSFSFAVFVSQYFLPLGAMPAAAGACGALGLLAFALSRGNRRRAALLLGLGLAAGFLWNFGYDTLIFSGARELDGVETGVTASVVDFPVDQDYRTYVDVKLRRDGAVPLKARAYVYDGSAEDLRPGDTVTFTALFSTADGDHLLHLKGLFSLREKRQGHTRCELPRNDLHKLPPLPRPRDT